jgi:hypothetical protein
MVKLTFTVDDETARRLRKLAERSRKPQSLIVREAIAHYEASRSHELTSSEERARLLGILDDLRTHPDAEKDPAVTGRELEELRESRRGLHREHQAE